MDYQYHANFIEDPAKRGPHDKAIMAAVTGRQYTSVFIEVSMETYLNPRFQEWLTTCIFTRFAPGSNGIALAITANSAPAN